eukprot:Nk52_evm18s266 gene=Nk52_evmTU18s266
MVSSSAFGIPPACKEVCLQVLDIENWREVDINCDSITNNNRNNNNNPVSSRGGGAQYHTSSIDNDISGGGYSFQHCPTRVLLHRCVGNTLELVELSTEVALVENAVRFRFPARLLPYSGGQLRVYENVSSGVPYVCVLVATAVSLHRLLFPHPLTFERSNSNNNNSLNRDQSRQSIFCENTFDLAELQLSCHNHKMITSSAAAAEGNRREGGGVGSGGGDGGSGGLIPNTNCPIDDNTAVLGCRDGSLLMLSLPPLQQIHNDIVSSSMDENEYATDMELAEVRLSVASIMKRLWTGLIPSFASGIVNKDNGESGVLNVSVLPGDEVLGGMLVSVGRSGDAQGNLNGSTSYAGILEFEIDCDTYVFCISADHKLRAWNLTTRECCMEIDITQYRADFEERYGDNNGNGSKKSSSSGSAAVTMVDHRVTVHVEKDDPLRFAVVVYFSCDDRKEFLVFSGRRARTEEDQENMAAAISEQGPFAHHGNVPPPNWKLSDKKQQFELHFLGGKQCMDNYLIDFSVSDSCLWGVWAKVEGYGKTICSYCPLYSDVGTGSGIVNQWKPVFPGQDEDIDMVFSLNEDRDDLLTKDDEWMLASRDPQEIVLERIFLPGRFASRVICNALACYRNDSVPTMFYNPKVSLADLQAEVIAAVQYEIYEGASGQEIDPDEYRTLVIDEWKRFYECVYRCYDLEQGHFSTSGSYIRNVHGNYDDINGICGIFMDENSCLPVVVKRSGVSFFRPCEELEYLYLSSAVKSKNNSSRSKFVSARAVSQSKLISNACKKDKGGSAVAGLMSISSSLGRDIVLFLDLIQYVADASGPQELRKFENDLFHSVRGFPAAKNVCVSLLEPPAEPNSVEDMAANASTRSSFALEFTRQYKLIRDPLRVLEVLLQALDYRTYASESQARNSASNGGNNVAFSQTVCDLLSMTFRQVNAVRSHICRDMLLAIYLVIHFGLHSNGDGENGEENMFSYIVPTLEKYAKAYFAVKWLSRQRTGENALAKSGSLPSLAFLQGSMSSLDISSKSENISSSSEVEEDKTMNEAFLIDQLPAVVAECHRLFGRRDVGLFEQCYPLSIAIGSLMLSMNHTAQDESSMKLSEFMFRKGQIVQLEQYIRLLNIKSAGLQYLSALTYMSIGEFYKAKDLFLVATAGVHNKERFLLSLVAKDEENAPNLESECSSSNLISYYMHIMRIFEQHGAEELLVFFAEAALVSTNLPEYKENFQNVVDDRVAILWSNVFKHTLDMGHYDKAYSAIVTNPDSQRRKDCLNRFVVVMCERKQLETLCQLPYIGMQQEVEKAILWKARTTDVEMMIAEDSVVNYYNFLYSFHVHRGNYRKASTVMFEFGQRLSLESRCHLISLQAQAKCYLASINTLSLVSVENAWVMIPCVSLKQRKEDVLENPGMSPKRKYDDDNEDGGGSNMMGVSFGQGIGGTSLTQSPKSNFKIYTVEDIRNLYHLALAELRLVQKEKLPAVNQSSLTANEVLSLLVQSGLYESAFSICSKFKIDCDGVFEAITSKCCQLSQIEVYPGSEDDVLMADLDLEWIREAVKENETNITTANGGHESADHDAEAFISYSLYSKFCSGMSFSEAKNISWKVLYMYLRKFDSRNVNYKYHKVVVGKMLSCNPELRIPVFIVRSFAKVNPGELLRLYARHGLFQEGAEFLLAMLNAVEGNVIEGHGKAEDFGFFNTLRPTDASVLLPYSAINEYLSYLRPYLRENRHENRMSDSGEEEDAMSVLESTETRINEYFERVKSTSEAMKVLQSAS